MSLIYLHILLLLSNLISQVITLQFCNSVIPLYKEVFNDAHRINIMYILLQNK